MKTRIGACVSTTAALLILTDCASLVSQVQKPNDPVGDGIVYYMPQQPIKITLTYPAATKRVKHPAAVPSIETIEPTADMKNRFLLSYDENYVGKNHLNVVVSTSGLLTSSNAETTSGIATIVQNLGKAIADIQGMTAYFAYSEKAQKPVLACPPGHAYSMLLDPADFTAAAKKLKTDANPLADTSTKLCGYTIAVTDLRGNDPVYFPDTNRVGDASKQSGVFYKQELAYLVSVTDPAGDPPTTFLAYSPNLSPVGFVPVTPTLFSNNQTNLTFSNGILTSMDASSDGEIVAASELPADFIDAYATALGGLFTQLGNSVQSQTTLINNQKALAVASAQKGACQVALNASKPTLDPKNLSGKTGAELATAVSNINTALANIKTVCAS